MRRMSGKYFRQAICKLGIATHRFPQGNTVIGPLYRRRERFNAFVDRAILCLQDLKEFATHICRKR